MKHGKLTDSAHSAITHWHRIGQVLTLSALCLSCGIAQATLKAFVTEATGTGKLSNWPLAEGHNGLIGADKICQNSAAQADLDNPEKYVAWLSDSQNDALCRVHNLSGQVADDCGQMQLPVGAGPWMNVHGEPIGGTLTEMLTPDYIMLRPVQTDEFGLFSDRQYFTGTTADGSMVADRMCDDWAADEGLLVAVGSSLATGSGFTLVSFIPCTAERSLLCLEAGDAKPIARPFQSGGEVFVTAASGNGDLSTWPLANGQTGLTAADAVCAAEAMTAQLINPQEFKAWMSDASVNAPDRFQYTGPWRRVDGVRVALSVQDFLNGRLLSPMNQTAVGVYRPNIAVWTSSSNNGAPSGLDCLSWTSADNSEDGTSGTAQHTDFYAQRFTLTCDSTNAHLYCLRDGPGDVIYLSGFD